LRDFPAFPGRYPLKNRFLINSPAPCTFEPRTGAARRNSSVTESVDKTAKKTTMSRTGAPSLPPAAIARNAHPGNGLLAEIAAFWREFIKTAFVPYYPERHYMRGPGPACAAKRKAAKS
jgi:hypothetical protein